MKYWGWALLAAVVSGAAPGQDGKKIQCWTDKDGHRMCGDRLPTEYAGTRREILQDGRVIDTVKAAKSPEELAEEKRRKQEADEAARRDDYDRALVQTYRNAKDIESMRDERLALIDTRIQAATKNSADNDHSLEGLQARVATLTKDGKPVDERLSKQVRQYERAQKENQAALTRYAAERTEVTTKFNRDLDRFNALRPPKPKKAGGG